MTNVDMRDVDDDEISVTSTAPSEEQSEYEVETILTERTLDNKPLYLVKWAGYPVKRATWEPAESFFNDETFLYWKKKKKAIAEGRQREFDLVSFEGHLIALENARDQRRCRREAKRERLGLSVEQTNATKKQRVDASNAVASSSAPSNPSSFNSDPGTARMNPPSTRPAAVKHIPPKPPMVLFGSGQTGQNRRGPWMAARNKNKKPDEPDGSSRPFSKLSTRWRFEKAKGYEPPPNIDQLELIRPSEWPARTGALIANPKVADRLVDSPKGDSPVASPVDRNNPVPGGDRYRPSSPAPAADGIRRRQHASDTWRPELFERQTSKDSWRSDSPRTRRPPLPERQCSRDSWRPNSYARDALSPERPAPDSRRPESSYSRDPSGRSGDSRRPASDKQPPPSNPERPGTPDERHLSQLSLENDGGSRGQWFSEEQLPPLPPRRPITIRGANFRRPRDEKSQSRFWNPGEIFVYMYLGPEKRSIGPVRLCGLSLVSKSKIMQSKKDNKIEIWFQEICTLDEYRELCNRSKTNYRYDNGWIEGYDDTEPDVYRTGKGLQRGNLLAIAYPEEPSWGKNVLLAYSPFSPEFDFLRNDYSFSPDTFLHLTVRNPLAHLDRQTPLNRSLRAIPARMPELQDKLPTPTEQNVEKDLEAQLTQEMQVDLPADTSNHVESPLLPQEQPRESNEPAPVQEKLSPHQQLQQQQQSVANFDVDEYFRDVFKMTFDVLATNNGVEKGRAQVFYLMCPNTPAQDECGIIVEFLKKHEAVIFSSRLEEDWERFVRTINRGVVLFHDSFVNYDTMYGLRGLVHKPFTFWSFSLTGIGEGDNKTYFQRLFPHGGVILLTEDFMVREPDATVIILAWFCDWTKKKFPGSWKMMLRPNVLEWLLTQPEPVEKQRQGVWLAMYSLIAQLSATDNGTHLTHSGPLDGIHDDSPENRIISPSAIPFYGSRTADDCPGVSMDATQEQRDTDHMAEFFAGWTLVNSHRFRRFTIVTTKPLKRWNLWNHVDVKETAMDFFKAYGVDYGTYWSRLRGKAPPKDKKEGESPDPPSSKQGPSRL